MQLAIDEIVYYGRLCNPRTMMPVDPIQASVNALFDELDARRVEYLLVGGVALLSYVEGRNTQDIDLIVRPDQIGNVSWQAAVRDRDFAEAEYKGIHVDLLLTSNRLFAEVMEKERSAVSFHGREIPTATREGLLLLKLYALPSLYRQGKLARAALYETDILLLRQSGTVDEHALIERLRPHLPTHDLRELERILEEQQSRSRFE